MSANAEVAGNYAMSGGGGDPEYVAEKLGEMQESRLNASGRRSNRPRRRPKSSTATTRRASNYRSRAKRSSRTRSASADAPVS